MLEQLTGCVAYWEKLKLGLQDGQFVKVKAQQVQALQKNASVFDASEQEDLMTAIHVEDGKKGGLRPRQEASSFQEFVTASDVHVLQDGLATVFQKIDQMATRMVSLGLVNPTEGTYGKVLMFLVITIYVSTAKDINTCISLSKRHR